MRNIILSLAMLLVVNCSGVEQKVQPQMPRCNWSQKTEKELLKGDMGARTVCVPCEGAHQRYRKGTSNPELAERIATTSKVILTHNYYKPAVENIYEVDGKVCVGVVGFKVAPF